MIFVEVIEHHPARLTVDELALRIVSDPDDGCEVETAAEAVRDLRRGGTLGAMIAIRGLDKRLGLNYSGVGQPTP